MSAFEAISGTSGVCATPHQANGTTSRSICRRSTTGESPVASRFVSRRSHRASPVLACDRAVRLLAKTVVFEEVLKERLSKPDAVLLEVRGERLLDRRSRRQQGGPPRLV